MSEEACNWCNANMMDKDEMERLTAENARLNVCQAALLEETELLTAENARLRAQNDAMREAMRQFKRDVLAAMGHSA